MTADMEFGLSNNFQIVPNIGFLENYKQKILNVIFMLLIHYGEVGLVERKAVVICLVKTDFIQNFIEPSISL